MSNNIKFLGCLKHFKRINNNSINNVINNNITNFKKSYNSNNYSLLYLNKTLNISINQLNNDNNNIIYNSLNKKYYSVGNRNLKNKQIINNLTKAKSNQNNDNSSKSNSNSNTILDNEDFNFNYVNPDNIKPYKARHLPFETTTNLDFIIPPGQPSVESKETLDKYLKLAKALSAVGYEHQESQKWDQALESFNKALFYIKIIYSSSYRSKIDLRDFAILLGNSAESLGRLDRIDEALVKSQQSIDLLEVSWREYSEKYGLANAKRNWVKDETLGIFYSNYSEYLLEGDKYEEAEPFLMRAHEILSKVYPLDHPVNVEIGISLVKVLNEMGRSFEVEKIFKKFGDIITNAMGKTEEFKHISDKVQSEIKYQMVEQIKNQYPELEIDHKDFEDDNEKEDDEDGDIIEYDEDGKLTIKSKKGQFLDGNQIDNENKDIENDEEDEEDEEDEDDEPIKLKYKEKEFDVQDLMILEENLEGNLETISGADKQLQFHEREFDELDDEDEEDFFQYDKGDEDEGDRENLVDDSISPKEEYLNLKLEEEVDKLKEKGEKVYSEKHPLGSLLNNFDDIFYDATKKLSEIEAEKIVDREQRLINKHSGIPERVVWQDGKIVTPTDSKGEPISQGAIDKWGKYYAEDLMDDNQDEEEMLDQYIEKMESLLDTMSKEESDLIDLKFKKLVPTLKTILKQDNPEEFFNTSLEDAEEDDNNQVKILEEKLLKLNKGLKEIKERKEALPKDKDGNIIIPDNINEEDYLKEFDVSEDFSIFDDEDESLSLDNKDNEQTNQDIEDDNISEDSEEDSEEDDNSEDDLEDDLEEEDDSLEESDEEAFTDEDYVYKEESYDEITEDTASNLTNNNSTSGGSVSHQSLVNFMDVANKYGFDEEKIISHIGIEEFEKIQKHFEKDSKNKQQSQKQDSKLNNKQQDDEDDSILDLLDDLEDDDVDGIMDDYKFNENLQNIGNGLEEIENLEDELIGQNNPEEDLDEYLNRVSSNEDFQKYLKDLNNK